MKQLFEELKRRNVYKVAVAYAAVAFVVWQAADLLFPALRFPAWTIDFVIVLTLLGFPVALVIAWAFEMTPEGVRWMQEARQPEEAEPTEERRPQSRLAFESRGLVAGAVACGWHLIGGWGQTEPTPHVGEPPTPVLPFEALGQDDAGPYTVGMHDALLTRLSNVSGLKSISPHSVQQYRAPKRRWPRTPTSWTRRGGGGGRGPGDERQDSG